MIRSIPNLRIHLWEIIINIKYIKLFTNIKIFQYISAVHYDKLTVKFLFINILTNFIIFQNNHLLFAKINKISPPIHSFINKVEMILRKKIINIHFP